jgi:hypothetical protein
MTFKSIHSDWKANQADAYQDPPNFTSVENANNGRLVRTSSQHVSQLTRLSALGSHSPNPPEQVEHMRQNLDPSHKTDDPVSRHRRRNTLPSVALSAHESQMLAATLGEVGMRPTSKTPLYSDGGLTRNIKRRSRSADELRDDARSHQMSPIQWRRRSGEIQYWRNSVLEKPLPGIQREAYNSRESERPRFRSVGPSPSSVDPSASRDSLKQFQFDSFTSANGQTATIEQRVTTLEVKFIDHEYAIAQLQGCDIARPVASANMPKRRSVQDLFPEQNERQFSVPFDQHGQTFLSSPRDSPTPGDDIGHPARQGRSSNVPTLRPINTSGVSFTSPSGDSPSSNEMTAAQFDKLMSTLKAEQAARRTLEEKVTELQAQIEGLRSAPHLHRRPGAYPTPSPDSRHSILAFRGQPTRRSVVCFPTTRVRSDETSRFSITDADDTDTDDGFLDTYETPMEAQDSKFGFHSNRSSTALAMI